MSRLDKIGFIFHTLVLAILPVLSLYANNQDKIFFGETLVPMLTVVSAALIMLLIVTRLNGSPGKSAIVVSLLLIAFFYYQPFGFMAGLLFHDPPEAGLVALWLLLLAMGIISIWRSAIDTSPLTDFLNKFAAGLLALMMVGLVAYRVAAIDAIQIKLDEFNMPDTGTSAVTLPDIYYLILDSYPGNSVLKSRFAFDNSEFTDFLRQKGFFIAENSRPNYCLTELSLASTLNMSYLNVTGGDTKAFNGAGPLIELIYNSRVARILKQRGYTTVAYSSGSLSTEMRNSDVYFSDSIVVKEFSDGLLRNTILAKLKLPFFNLANYQADVHRYKVKRPFLEIPSLSGISRPFFVFAHIPCPHAPFVFKSDGSVLPTSDFSYDDGNALGAGKDRYRSLFIDQLKSLNGLIKDFINSLLQDTGRPKVIILQADHGSAMQYHYTDINRCDLSERFSILNAIYMPDKNYAGFYVDQSPVNSFRLIFGAILRKAPELLSDRYFHSGARNRYDFLDIGDRL